MLTAVVAALVLQQATEMTSRTPPSANDAATPTSGAAPSRTTPRGPDLSDAQRGVAPPHRATGPGPKIAAADKRETRPQANGRGGDGFQSSLANGTGPNHPDMTPTSPTTSD